MAIHRLLAGSAYDQAKVRLMVEAYECACKALDLMGEKSDELTDLVARKIVEVAHTEIEADAKLICERSLRELGITQH